MTIKVPQPILELPDFGFAPQFGHLSALVLTSWPHSLHFINAISSIISLSDNFGPDQRHQETRSGAQPDFPESGRWRG